jgi:acyl CoA:acetate/3-ketoacid CoA transferase alpha subunit
MAGAAKITVAEVEELLKPDHQIPNSYSWNIRATCFSGDI